MRVYTRNAILVVAASLIWLIIGMYFAGAVAPNISTTLQWVPVLVLFPYASYAIYKSSEELSQGIAKSILKYEMLFMVLTTIYFFLQRMNEIFYKVEFPAAVAERIYSNYSTINVMLNSAAVFVLIVSFLAIFYVVSVTEKFSIAYGFKDREKVKGHAFRKMLAASLVLGIVYDSLILVFLGSITAVSATLIEMMPLLVLGVVVFYNLSMTVNRFTDMTKNLLLAGGLFIVLLILHFIIRYIDINILLSGVDIGQVIAAYAPERIIISVVLYGVLISILAVAVGFSRNTRMLVEKYSMK